MVSHRIAVPAVFAAGLTLFGASVAGAQPGITAPAPEAQGQSGVTSAAPTPPPAPAPAPSASGCGDSGCAGCADAAEAAVSCAAAEGTASAGDAAAFDDRRSSYSEPTYVAPQGPSVVAPRVEPPAPIEAPPDTVRIGSFEAARPAELPKDATDKVNAWSAFFESKIASGYDAAGCRPGGVGSACGVDGGGCGGCGCGGRYRCGCPGRCRGRCGGVWGWCPSRCWCRHDPDVGCGNAPGGGGWVPRRCGCRCGGGGCCRRRGGWCRCGCGGRAGREHARVGSCA